MPRKTKFTRDDIIDAAFALVRERGGDALSARSLAAALGVSTAPIFTLFSGIEELYSEVVARARAYHTSFIEKGREHKIPFKGMGIMYIKFAREEPMLFEMLFMKGNSNTESKSYLPGSYFMGGEVLSELMNSYGEQKPCAMELYNHLSVYVFGLAVLSALGSKVFSDSDIENMLSVAFNSFRRSINEKGN